MRKGLIRWVVLLGTGLACLLVPACSESRARPARAKGASQPAAHPRAATRTSVAEKPGNLAPERTPATGAPRANPFVPVFDPKARRTQSAEVSGPLVLKAVYGGPTRMAIIEQGRHTHFVQEGDQIGSLQVLAVRENEVVLTSGRRKQVLSLYER